MVNTATVTAANETTAEQNQSATATVNVTAPDVDITKTTSTPTVNAGGTASFTVTVFNEGTGDATGVSFSDPLPAGAGSDIVWAISGASDGFSISGTTAGSQSLVFSATTLAAGESHTVTITGTVSAADADPTSFTGTLVNTATVTAANETTAEQNQSCHGHGQHHRPRRRHHQDHLARPRSTRAAPPTSPSRCSTRGPAPPRA